MSVDVLRALLVLLAPFAFIGLSLYGSFEILDGQSEQRNIENMYEVVFVDDPGDDCAEGRRDLYVSTTDGAIMQCIPSWMTRVYASADLHGFTDDQNSQVGDLVEELGRGGLTEGEQAQIQHVVDGFAAAVPEDERLYRDQWVYGTARIWYGAAMIATGIGVLGPVHPRHLEIVPLIREHAAPRRLLRTTDGTRLGLLGRWSRSSPVVG